MAWVGKKLGLLLSASPGQPTFQHCLGLAAAALRQRATVYLYCIDEAVNGLQDTQLKSLQERGLILYACAYSAQKRGVAINDAATFSGLGILSDIITGTDRFLSFN